MPKIKSLHPEKWIVPGRETGHTKLTADETLVLAMCFTTQDVRYRQDIAHATFIVVEKGDKAVARVIINHIDSQGMCDGHSDDIAEYPATDKIALCKEVKDMVLHYAMKLLSDEDNKVTIDMKRPIFMLQAKPNMKTENIKRDFALAVKDDDSGMAQIVSDVLGMGETNTESTPTSTEKIIEELTKSPIIIANTAITPEKEEELIKLYGIEAMEELAKKMNYHGILLNKEINHEHN